jgi:hypothetical protein
MAQMRSPLQSLSFEHTPLLGRQAATGPAAMTSPTIRNAVFMDVLEEPAMCRSKP